MDRTIPEGACTPSLQRISPPKYILSLMNTELETLAQIEQVRSVQLRMQSLETIVCEGRGNSQGSGPKRINGPIKTTQRSPDDTERNTNILRVPIEYANVEIGEIQIEHRQRTEQYATLKAHASIAAKKLALLAKRHQVHLWIQNSFGMNMLFVGQSLPLQDVEGFVERASQNVLPVLLTGEFGTEKALTAMAVHALSTQSEGAFVETQCGSLNDDDDIRRLAENIAAAAGGTVYFNAIDEVPLRLLQKFPELLGSRIGQWLPRNKDKRPPRIIAATTSNLHEMVQSGRFPKALLAEIDFLSLQLPPLRTRHEDIPAMLSHLLDKNGFSAAEKCTPEFVRACMAYVWPENLFELERAVVRLAAKLQQTVSVDDYGKGVNKDKLVEFVVKKAVTTALSYVPFVGGILSSAAGVGINKLMERESFWDSDPAYIATSMENKMRVYYGLRQEYREQYGKLWSGYVTQAHMAEMVRALCELMEQSKHMMWSSMFGVGTRNEERIRILQTLRKLIEVDEGIKRRSDVELESEGELLSCLILLKSVSRVDMWTGYASYLVGVSMLPTTLLTAQLTREVKVVEVAKDAIK